MLIAKYLYMLWLTNSVGAFNSIALSTRPILNPFHIDLFAKPPSKPHPKRIFWHLKQVRRFRQSSSNSQRSR